MLGRELLAELFSITFSLGLLSSSDCSELSFTIKFGELGSFVSLSLLFGSSVLSLLLESLGLLSFVLKAGEFGQTGKLVSLGLIFGSLAGGLILGFLQ